jgi:hypothetical protein
MSEIETVKAQRGVIREPGVQLSCTGVSVRPTADRVSPVLAMWIAGYSLPAIKADTGMEPETVRQVLAQVRGELRVHVTDVMEARITLAAYCKMIRETYMHMLLFGKSRNPQSLVGLGRVVLTAVEVESKLLGLDSITINHTSTTFERMLDRLATIKAQAAGLPAPGDVVDGVIVESSGGGNNGQAKGVRECGDAGAHTEGDSHD